MKVGKVAAGCIAVLGLMAPVAQASADEGGGVPSAKETGNYIVLLEEDPVIAYEGGTAGLAATAPEAGADIDQSSPAVQAYVAHLDQVQDATLAAVGAPESAKLVDYTYAANGFTASLNAAQAAALKTLPGVTFVMADQIHHVQREVQHGGGGRRDQTVNDFLGLTDRRGPYANGITGENVVIGIIDTGIWPEHPSFADDGTYPPLPADEWSGTGCDFGNVAFNPNDAPFTCNNKLLAAKAYGTVFHGGTGEGLSDDSYNSARDDDGHGTHTSSTAGGNADVHATIFGRDYGTISGIAPRARISMYKACWTTSLTEGGCSTGDLAEAIDEAVADGVDVINYSIGSDTPGLSLDGLSFLFANDAGVYVAASAGNAGSGAGTVGSPAVLPWLTAVGASTQSVAYTGTVKLGNHKSYTGYTVTGGLESTPLVDAADHGNPLCLIDVPFTPSVAGKIVLCERGPNRVLKSIAVQQAGGVGMVLFNTAPLDEMTDNHFLPTLHVPEDVGLKIRQYIDNAGANATASLSGGKKSSEKGNEMTYFSSRGPNGFSPDIISPDVTAPGLRILAGASPTGGLNGDGGLFQAIAGTSMSSPHVAGVYALLKQAHPEWSAAAAKSALMTSARQDIWDPSSGAKADPFDFGAGHIAPGGKVSAAGSLYNPGLVYDAGFADYLGYLCEADRSVFANPDVTCGNLEAAGVPTTAENLNLASIGVSDITGTATVTRTVTNVTGETSFWFGVVKAPAGFTAEVEPNWLVLDPDESTSFTVTLTRTDAAYDTWSFGSLTWYGWGGYQVRSPIAAQAKLFAAPAEVQGTGTEGSGELTVGFGYDGDYTADAHGLIAATETAGNVIDDPANDINVALETGVGITEHLMVVPEGTAVARFSLFDGETDGPGDDLDLYVFDEGGNFVGGSGTGTSEEQVDVLQPAAGTYSVFVHGWETDGPDSNYTLFSWAVPFDDGAGSLSITSAPTEAVSGTTGTVAYAWTGLTAGVRYLGAISHNSSVSPEGPLAVTTVTVNA